VIPGSPTSTRLETRVNGSDTNPYLSLAAALASGLYGIEKKLKLKTKPITGSGYQDTEAVPLPRNLAEATQRFQSSDIARSLLGSAFVEHFAKTRLWEWRQFSKAVTDWETKRYLEII
jgi:glutamine synthetase